MAEKKLVSYVQKQIKKGFSKKSIRKKLLEKGHPAKAVEEAFSSISKPIAVSPHNLIYVLIALIVVIIIIGGVVYVPKLIAKEEVITEKPIQPKVREEKEPEKPVEQIQDIGEEDKDQLVEKEFKSCVEDSGKNYSFYHSCIALSQNDVSLCELMEDKSAVNVCKGYFFADRGIIYKDINDCEKVEEIRLIEGEIMDEANERGCQRIVNNDLSFCEEIDDDFSRGFCRVTITRDIESCDNIDDPDSYDLCSDQYYTLKAIENKDPSYCNEIKSVNDYKRLRIKCLSISSGDPSYCDLEYDQVCHDIAHYNVGINLLDIGLCNKIADEASRKDCIDIIYDRKRECDKIQDEEIKNGCYNAVYYDLFWKGLRGRDKSTCEEIGNYEIKKACISVIDNNLKLCKSVQEPQYKLFCIREFVERTRDKSLCNELPDEEGIQQCMESLRFD